MNQQSNSPPFKFRQARDLRHRIYAYAVNLLMSNFAVETVPAMVA
jgi:hypothetical protein